MENNTAFHYEYSAKESAEVQAIRKKYMPQPESKLEELKRLDAQVQGAGTIESLVVGIVSALVFGTGMCHAMQVLGSGTNVILCGVALGLVGIVGMLTAYPIHRKLREQMKAKLAPRILELAAELDGNASM